MADQPSERIIDQRIRNRIMEAIHTLAEGNDGVQKVWPDEYFESLYTWIPHRDDGAMPPNSVIPADEREQLQAVSFILDDACDATPAIMTADEFIATGWPAEIQPIAQAALNIMTARGRYSEQTEEVEPFSANGWPQ